jgi:hypothetical protein
VPLAATLAALLACAAGRSASAAPQGCSPQAEAWVREASSACGLAISLDACPAGLQRLLLRPQAGPALAVEVGIGGGYAFRRAGAVRLSPILVTDDFSAVAAPAREGFERLASWASAHEARIVESFDGGGPESRAAVPTGGAPPGRGRAPWLVVAAAVSVALGWIAWRPSAKVRPALRARDRWIALGLFAAALALRAVLGSWGPFHVNGMAPLWVLEATGAGQPGWGYGPGFRELFGAVTLLRPGAPDEAVFALNAVLSAVAAPLAFGLARACGLDAARGGLAAAVCLADPASLRAAATESYFPPIVALTLGAGLLAAWTTRAALERRALAALGLALGAGLLAAQAARIHPCAWLPVAIVPLAALAAGPEASLRLRAALALAAGVAIGGTVAATSGAAVAAALRAPAAPHLVASPLSMPEPRALVLLAACTAGALLLASPRWIALPAAANLLLAFATRDLYCQHPLWQAAYERLFYAWPVLLLVSVVPARLLARRAALAAAWLAPLVLLASGWRTVRSRTLDHDEYRWFARALAGVPGSCRVLYVSRAGHHIAMLPEYRAPAGGPTRFVRLGPHEGGDALSHPVSLFAGCRYFARTSLCSSEAGREACDAALRGERVTLVGATTLAVRPSHAEHRFDAPVIEVGLARIDGALDGER